MQQLVFMMECWLCDYLNTSNTFSPIKVGLFPVLGWATGCMHGKWLRSVMSVSNNPTNLCLEMPHCASKALSAGVCGLQLQPVFWSAHFISFFIQLSVFLSSALRRVPRLIWCTHSFCVPLLLPTNTWIFSPSSLLFSRGVYSTSLQRGHNRAEYTPPEQRFQLIYSSCLPSKGALIQQQWAILITQRPNINEAEI